MWHSAVPVNHIFIMYLHGIYTLGVLNYSFTFAISGSDDIRFTNLVIIDFPSSIPSSMLMSSTCAPLSTCSLAIDRAP